MDEISSNNDSSESNPEKIKKKVESNHSEGLKGDATNSFEEQDRGKIIREPQKEDSRNLDGDLSNSFENKSKEDLEKAEGDSKPDIFSPGFTEDGSSSFEDSEKDASKESNDKGDKRGQDYAEWVKNGNTNEILNACENDPKTKEFADYIKNNNVEIRYEDLGNNVAGTHEKDENGNDIITINNNEQYQNEYANNPDGLKALIAHEGTHAMGGDEYDAWKASADTGYDNEARDIIYNNDGSLKPEQDAISTLQSDYGYDNSGFSNHENEYLLNKPKFDFKRGAFQ